MSEYWDRVLEAMGLVLLKVAVSALVKQRKEAGAKPQQVICVEVPAAITKAGGTLEVHWIGATRVEPAEAEKEE